MYVLWKHWNVVKMGNYAPGWHLLPRQGEHMGGNDQFKLFWLVLCNGWGMDGMFLYASPEVMLDPLTKLQRGRCFFIIAENRVWCKRVFVITFLVFTFIKIRTGELHSDVKDNLRLSTLLKSGRFQLKLHVGNFWTERELIYSGN